MNTTTVPSPLSYEAIGAIGEEVGVAFEIYDPETGRADLDKLVHMLGAKVYATEDYDSREASLVDRLGRLTIFLPLFTSNRRDRFTQAHELGHFFIHYVGQEKTGPAAFARGGSGVAETQANVFAASLLMPAGQFKEQYALHGGDSWKLASVFGVSPAAASVRAQVLKLGT
jgi:Zn-dependent peptidase ImmA (M78 family)